MGILAVVRLWIKCFGAQLQVVEAQAGQARWASIAAELYSVISEAGLDQSTPSAPTVPTVPTSPRAAASAASIVVEPPGATKASGSLAHPGSAAGSVAPSAKKKRRRQ